MTMKQLARTGVSTILISLLGSPVHSWAAEASAPATGTLDEIVVSAQKRTELVQDVPVSITVLTNEELSRQGVQTINDLSRMSASLEFTAPGAAPGGGAFIRGIGTESVGGATATGSVSVVLDGVVLGNTNVTDIFDVARVEILKGPQGTLFGSSVSAGVISLTTAAPDPSAASSSVSAEYGSKDMASQFDRRSLRAVTNLPLTADSALRLSFHADENDGVFHNPYLGADSTDEDTGVRARYLWNVNDDLTLNVIGDYNREYQAGIPELTVRIAPTTPPFASLANTLAGCGVTASTSNFSFCSQISTFQEYLNRGVSGQVDWVLHGMTLTSISSLRLGTSSNRTDIEGLPIASAATNFALGSECQFFNCVPLFAIQPGGPNAVESQKRTQLSEEIRLASAKNNKLEWVTGLYYQHYKLSDDEPGITTANFGGGTDTTSSYYHNNVHTQDYAAFGNATYYFTDSLRLIAGARYTHSNVFQNKYDPADTGTDLTYTLSTSASKPSYRIGLQDNLTSHTMLYATVATGYKGPEISDLLSHGGHLYAVAPETPTSYEIGIKESALDDRLAIDADIFYEHVKDYQGQQCAINALGTFSCAPDNVSAVDTKGLELDVFGKPWTGMTVNFSAILNPATYPKGYLGSDGTDLGGKQLNYASKTKATLSAQQTIPITGIYSAVVGADAAYRSQQSEYVSAAPQFIVPAGTIVNARLGITSSHNWSAYVFGRNLSRVVFPRQLYPVPFQTGGYWQVFDQNSLRVVGLQIEAKF